MLDGVDKIRSRSRRDYEGTVIPLAGLVYLMGNKMKLKTDQRYEAERSDNGAFTWHEYD